MKRTRLRKVSKSPITTIKNECQAIFRQIVMIRDKGCVLREVRNCGATLHSGITLQADHLITRANNATFADTRLIVCLCKPCHGGWKQWHKEDYDALVRKVIPIDRVALWDKKEAERKQGLTLQMTLSDWKLTKLALEKELQEAKLNDYETRDT